MTLRTTGALILLSDSALVEVIGVVTATKEGGENLIDQLSDAARAEIRRRLPIERVDPITRRE